MNKVKTGFLSRLGFGAAIIESQIRKGEAAGTHLGAKHEGHSFVFPIVDGKVVIEDDADGFPAKNGGSEKIFCTNEEKGIYCMAKAYKNLQLGEKIYGEVSDNLFKFFIDGVYFCMKTMGNMTVVNEAEFLIRKDEKGTYISK